MEERGLWSNTHRHTHTHYTHTWILRCWYVVVEYGPEGTHLVCCEFWNECIVMFLKLYNGLNFARLQEEYLLPWQQLTGIYNKHKYWTWFNAHHTFLMETSKTVWIDKCLTFPISKWLAERGRNAMWNVWSYFDPPCLSDAAMGRPRHKWHISACKWAVVSISLPEKHTDENTNIQTHTHFYTSTHAHTDTHTYTWPRMHKTNKYTWAHVLYTPTHTPLCLIREQSALFKPPNQNNDRDSWYCTSLTAANTKSFRRHVQRSLFEDTSTADSTVIKQTLQRSSHPNWTSINSILRVGR
jgi:hypothetical protein